MGLGRVKLGRVKLGRVKLGRVKLGRVKWGEYCYVCNRRTNENTCRARKGNTVTSCLNLVFALTVYLLFISEPLVSVLGMM